MKIYTLTLNPAYDVHAICESFSEGHENLVRITSKEAGGKGVNISRALQNAHVQNTAWIVLGKDNSAQFVDELRAAELDCLYLERDGFIRENITIHPQNDKETRISFAGFALDAAVLTEIAGRLDVDQNTVVTFTGSVPKGLPIDKVKMFLKDLKSRGAKLVIDSKSLSLQDLLEIGPWLIKPNQEEISMYFSEPIETICQAVAKGKVLLESQIGNVMISMGDQGAVLLNDGKIYVANAPRVSVVSTIGAGDSSIAGFITAASHGEGVDQCLRYAVAFGSAACMTEGSKPPQKAVIDRLLPKIEVQEVV